MGRHAERAGSKPPDDPTKLGRPPHTHKPCAWCGQRPAVVIGAPEGAWCDECRKMLRRCDRQTSRTYLSFDESDPQGMFGEDQSPYRGRYE